jgi:hypothetical protein
MQPATKGVILSGLVYPGIGQIFLGRKYSGLGIIIVSTIALVVLIYRVVIRFYRSLDPLIDLLMEKSLTFQSVKMVFNQSGYVSWKVELISLTVFVFCWVGAMVHAYYLGLNTDGSQMTGDGTRNSEFRDQNQELKG